jgi:glutaminyl-tRNA synthetase
LRYAYFITCRVVVMDASGEAIELRCTYDPQTRGGNTPPDGRKVKATLHWVAAADAVHAEVHLVNPLFLNLDPDLSNFADEINPDSLEVLTGCMVEPAAVGSNFDAAMQFERQGYFIRDATSVPGKAVFIRTVGLRDTFAKALAKVDAGRA